MGNLSGFVQDRSKWHGSDFVGRYAWFSCVFIIVYIHSTSWWEKTCSHIECLGTEDGSDSWLPRLKWSVRSLHGTDKFKLEIHTTNYFLEAVWDLWFALQESPSEVFYPFPYIGDPENFKARRGPKFPPAMGNTVHHVGQMNVRMVWQTGLERKKSVGTLVVFCVVIR